MANRPPNKKQPYQPADEGQSDREYEREMAQYDAARRASGNRSNQAPRPETKTKEESPEHESPDSKPQAEQNPAYKEDVHKKNPVADNSASTDENHGPRKNPSAEYLESLPIRSVMVGGERKRGRYDQETHYVYLDDGTVVKVNPPKKAPPPKRDEPDEQPTEPKRLAEKEEPQRITDGSNHGWDDDDAEPRKLQRNKKVKKKDGSSAGGSKKKVAIIAVLAVVAVVTFGLQYIASMPSDPQSEPSGTQAETGPTTEVEVVQLTQDVIAGTQVTEDLIEPYVISAESFNQISLSGVNLYQWDRKDMLLGMYVATYLPRGQYLSYDSLVAAYEPPQNIFGTLEDGQYIDIPITLKESESGNFVPGAAFDVTVRKSTLVENPEGGEATSIDGMDHTSSVEQSVRIDEYKLNGAIAVDIIAADGSSMYQTFSSLLSIPAGEQAHYIEAHSNDTAFINSVTPAYIRIAASESQIETLGSMNGKNTECIFTPLPDKADKSTNEKAEFYANAEVLAAQLQNYVPAAEAGDTNE